jgi:hypothetical protein
MKLTSLPYQPYEVMGEIYGKISALNFKSPIKTIKVENVNKNNGLKDLTLVITNETRVYKNLTGKTPEKEPMLLTDTALMVGQGVTVVYLRDEVKSRALFITITKE